MSRPCELHPDGAECASFGYMCRNRARREPRGFERVRARLLEILEGWTSDGSLRRLRRQVRATLAYIPEPHGETDEERQALRNAHLKGYYQASLEHVERYLTQMIGD